MNYKNIWAHGCSWSCTTTLCQFICTSFCWTVPSELLLCVVALARLGTEESCANTNNERSIVRQRDLWNIDFVFHCFLFNLLFQMFIVVKKGFIQRGGSASAWHFCLLLWIGQVHLGTPAELAGSVLWINILSTLTRIGDCSKLGNTSVKAKTVLNRAR